jgi:signal transduction histidine kinase
VILEIADDGVGFDPAAVRERGGMGLRGMAERAEQLGGQLRIESEPGAGTIVQVQVEGDQ